MNDQKYLVSESLLRAIHEYLILRPMREVEPLVTALRNVDKKESSDVHTAV